jgi:hypothetical protein
MPAAASQPAPVQASQQQPAEVPTQQQQHASPQMVPGTTEAEAAYQQQQQQQQHWQQWQQQMMQQQAPAPTGPDGQADLSSIQYAQLQQLQFQAMQWQYLQQLQQHQAYLQQQQQGGSPGPFDPTTGQTAAAGGQQRYRSQYAGGYGAYPQQQQQQVDENGQPLPADQPQPAENQEPLLNPDGSPNVNAVQPPARTRYHNDQHAPSVDPNAWNASISYASKSNPDRYLSHRNYFSHIPPVINRLPRKPELKELVQKGRDFYTNNRDPRFYSPIKESGWDNRAQVVKVPITGGGPHPPASNGFRYPEGAAYADQQPQQLPNVEEAKEAFGHFPVLVDNPSANIRPGSKLLLPFIHNWPPPFRFDYLKKHSRAPLSPFLASQNGYEVPPELYMSARQKAEMQRAQEQQMREQQGYPGAYPGMMHQQQYDPNNPQAPPPQQQQHRPSAKSSDPIERARARANTHTTYWRTVNPDGEENGDASGAPGANRQGGVPSGSQRSLSDRGNLRSGSASAGQGKGRAEWDGRHHLAPKAPRVGQTTAKKPAATSSRRERTMQQLQQQQIQQQQMQQWAHHAQQQQPPFGMLPPLIGPDGQPIMPPYFFYPPPPGQQMGAGGQMMMQLGGGQQMYGQQQEMYGGQQQQEEDQQQQQFEEQKQQYEDQQDQQQSQQQSPQQQDSPEQSSSDPASSTAPSSHQAIHHLPPPSDQDAAPGLNPNAGQHIKAQYEQIYGKQQQQQEEA